MRNRFCSFFLFLGGESEKCHLKSSVDDHNDGNGCRKAKDKRRRVAYDFWDIIEVNITIPKLT